MDPLSRTALEPIAAFIRARISVQPVVGMICGSGLGGLADLVTMATILPYSEIPGFPVSTAPGHSGRLVAGTLAGQTVIIMQVVADQKTNSSVSECKQTEGRK